MFDIPSSMPRSIFDELWRLQEGLDDIFGSSWSSSLSIRSAPRGSFPAVNVCRTPERVEVYLFAPGVDPRSLDVSLQQNLLTVSGKRELGAGENVNYYRQERFSGEFRRVISLPEDVDPDRVHAKYADGIVQIAVERRESGRPREIQIH
jgi:HSP20 family protein